MEVTDDQIQEKLVEMIKTDSTKLASWALIIIARDLYKSNTAEFIITQDQEMEDGKRVEIKIKGKIKEI